MSALTVVAVDDVRIPDVRDREPGHVQDLADSIAAIGLLHPPVVAPDMTLVAGGRRLAAVRALGWDRIPVRVVDSLADAATALRAEIDENTCRLDLTPPEAARARARRAEALKPLAKANSAGNATKRGGNLPPRSEPVGKVRDVAAQGSGYSGRTLDKVDVVLAAAEDPEAPESVRVAAKAAVVALAKPRANVNAAAKLVARAKRDAELAATPPPPVADLAEFPILYVDPPWRYEHAPDEGRAIENHYPTMTAAELAAMKPPAADNAVILMWATSPKLAEALDLMRAWGFDYRTCMVWVKDRIGMGYYARQRHELLLIGRRGSGLVPDDDRRPDSVVQAPRGEHSAKPHTFYDLIESMWPQIPKVELFARNSRAGWAAWGNQC